MNFVNLKVGDGIQIYCTGALVDATIIEIDDQKLTAKHKPVQWGNEIYTQTTAHARQTLGDLMPLIPHCYKDGKGITGQVK